MKKKLLTLLLTAILLLSCMALPVTADSTEAPFDFDSERFQAGEYTSEELALYVDYLLALTRHKGIINIPSRLDTK